jgi:two-component system sensor histidine kinase DesK
MRNDRHRLRYLWLAYLLLYPLPWLSEPPGLPALVVSAGGLALFLPIYLRGYVSTGWRSAGAALAILGLGFALQPTHGLWGVFAIYAASMASATEPPRLGRRVLVGIGVAFLAFVAVLRLPALEWVPTLFFGTLVALSSLHFATVELKNRELAASREEVRRLAVLAERERISRDVHDLLGHTLTLVAVKADLAGKLVDRDPALARVELEEIRLAARRGLADVRAAVTGMRSTTLAAEVAGARQALATADVALDAHLATGELPASVETALALVLREATTNVVRHANAARCRLRLERRGGEVVLEVRDDGHGLAAGEGNGVKGMRERLALLGGTLELARDRGTVLTARVPLLAPGDGA